ncbi:CD2 antigen cytoplasmic tail-binding protein 2 homolog [Venturia canescens]|uniref:CD2 antigen cytoplasmic tail-binding protein 2 homolog n=1 Tax=Venturia canescens TaxID=32260 RepID=UPI001C9CE546|nr:CD2 antigen cytoplasmic tail-binding protein 2 homolog [Venturia canescens]
MSKRKLDEYLETPSNPTYYKVPPNKSTTVQNSLDSDEEDAEVNEDRYNVMNEEEFEGIDDEPLTAETSAGFTAFNMKEELEEGHFDKEGHYLWNKEKEIRDNWLDNINWVQIKPRAEGEKSSVKDNESKGLADSDSEDDDDILFDPTPLYKQILEYLETGETVSKALCRLGKGKKRMTTAERWKKKKELAKKQGAENEGGSQKDADPKKPEDGKNATVSDESSDKIVKLTELANELLTRTGNMDIYQESYDSIKKKVEKCDKQEAELDMYADDFDTKEKAKFTENNLTSGEKTMETEESNRKDQSDDESVTWELKWSQNDDAEINGPHTTEQMQAWSKEGYFKSGAWVRRTGQQGQFYSAARVDFELYL